MGKVYEIEGMGPVELDAEDLSPEEVHRLLQLYTEGKVADGKSDPQVSRNLRSVRQGITDPLIGAAQFLGNINPLRKLQDPLYEGLAEKTGLPLTAKSMNEYVGKREGQYRKESDLGQNDIDWYRGLGNVLSPVNIGLGGAPEVARTLTGRAVEGAGRGAMYGAAMPVTGPDFEGEKEAQVGLSSLVGGALSPISSAASRVVAPVIPEEVQAMRNLGVTPTIGQRMGEKANLLEQAMTSAPLLGSGIKEARNRTITQFNVGLANKTMETIGERIPRDVAPGYDMINYMGNRLGERYDQLLPNLVGVMDKPFQSQLNNLRTMTRSLPRDVQRQFDDILKSQVTEKFTSHGRASGETLKEIESDLGRMAAGYMRDLRYDQVQLGSAIREVQRSLRQMIERNNPNYAGELQPINQAWSNFLRLENASSTKGAAKNNGVFTPSQLLTSVKRMDPTRKKSQFARGKAQLQEEGRIGNRVLGSHIPDSGTPFRTAVNLGLLGGGYALNPKILGLELAMMAPYTSVGQRAADLALSGGMGWRQPIGEGVRRLGALSTPALVNQFKDN